METIEISEKFTEIGNDLILNHEELEYINNSKARILFVKSDKAKKKGNSLIFGECSKVSNKTKFAIKADFIIYIYLPNCLEMNFSSAKYKLLLLHELLHVGIKYTKEGEEQYFIRPHDFEEFEYIVKKYGLGWANPQTEFDF